MNIIFEILFITSIISNIILFLIIKKCLFKIDDLEIFILKFKNDVKSLYKNLTYIDDRSMFEKDDDVGTLFLQISDMIKTFKNTVLNDEFIDDEKKDSDGS